MDLDIIFFPFHDWKKCERQGWNERESHQLIELDESSLVRRILVIDRPISIPEVVRYPHHWKARGKSVYRWGGSFLTQVGPKTYVLDQVIWQVLRPLRLRLRWWAYIMQQPHTVQKVQHAVEYLGLHKPVLWLTTPFSTHYIGMFGETVVIYDAFDNMLGHPEWSIVRNEVLEANEQAKAKADIILAVSPQLQDTFVGARGHVVVMPNAIGRRFVQNMNGTCPADLRDIKRPIIGYAGRMANKLDIDLLRYLAASLPDASLVFVGATGDTRSLKPLLACPNVFFLGEKHYSMIPAYLANFDVCLLPHRINELTRFMGPQKLYEYLAVGKPVVATPSSAIEHLGDVIRIAKDKEDYLSAIKDSLLDAPETAVRRKDAVRDHLWGNRIAVILHLIEETRDVKGL